MPQSGMTAPPRGEPSVPASIAAKSVARRSRKKVRLTTKFASVHGRALGSPCGRAGAKRLRGELCRRARRTRLLASALPGPAPAERPTKKEERPFPGALAFACFSKNSFLPYPSNIPSSSRTSCLGTLAQSKSGKRLSGVRGAGSGCRP